MNFKAVTVLICCGAMLCACATSTVDKRRSERMAAYQELTPEFQKLADTVKSRSVCLKMLFISLGKTR
jgi:cytochrome c556